MMHDSPTYIDYHLRDRHINRFIHRVWTSHSRATFPLYNLSGQLVGYQQYNPKGSKQPGNNPKDGKYFTYATQPACWGLESLSIDTDILYLTEGIFDAARLTNRGLAAIAVLSNDPRKLKQWLGLLGERLTLISICDSGKAGIKLAKYAHHYHIMPEAYDLGDAPEEYINQLLSRSIKL